MIVRPQVSMRARPRRRGLGMYPDQTCFDPARPSWLPYWVDDLTESGCKWNLLTAGNTTGNTSQPGTFGADGQPLADAGAVQNAMAACMNQGGSWDANLQACAPDQIKQYLPWVVGGLAAVAVLGVVLRIR